LAALAAATANGLLLHMAAALEPEARWESVRRTLSPPPEKFTPPLKRGICLTPPLKGCKRKHDRSVYESVL